jgi:toxin ParE1/3/4
MSWRIEFSESAGRDIDILFEHLADSYLEFGDSRSEAAERAVNRIGQILDTAERIATAPHRGERHDDLMLGLRHLTLERAIYWYRIDEARRVVSILAVFYGGADHQRKILLRLLSSS